MAFQALNGTTPTAPVAKLHAQQQSDTFVQNVQAAFKQQPHLGKDILNTATPHQYELFSRIANYVLNLQAQLQTPAPSNGVELSKKRKLDVVENGSTSTPHHASRSEQGAIKNPRITFQCKDVSFAVPARKKFKLQVAVDEADENRQEVQVVNSQSNAIEYAIPSDRIEAAFSLPVPEKQQRQRNFILLPREGATNADGVPLEQVVFTQNEAPIKDDGASSQHHPITEDTTYASITAAALTDALKPMSLPLITPSDSEFASSIPQSHRKGEKAYHVKAHKGSKEGYLFFLSYGILFGFKKPLQFFPFSVIDSISYTSVLQRTFNLVITTMAAGADSSEETVEHEFSMLDQADFAGIDAYVKSHGLNDASMAAERRARAYNVNKEKKENKADAHGEPAEDGQSELQKAEQQLQDEEDEEEEDYDPSGGESEGEGGSSEEEDGGEGYEEVEGEDFEEVEDEAEVVEEQ